MSAVPPTPPDDADDALSALAAESEEAGKAVATDVAPRYCLTCDYDLRGAPAGVCPECGRMFAPGKRRTWSTVPRRTRIRRRMVAAFIWLVVGAAVAAGWAWDPGVMALVIGAAGVIMTFIAAFMAMTTGRYVRREHGRRVLTGYTWPRRRL